MSASLAFHSYGRPQAASEVNKASAISSTRRSGAEATGTLLARVREKANRTYADLVNFVCRERIERFRETRGSSTEQKIDVITSSVAFENGEERYTDIRQNDRSLKAISGVRGAWSEGEFCTLLREATKVLNRNEGRFTASDTPKGRSASIYMFNFDKFDSPWDIRLGSKHYRIPFHGEIWIDPANAELLRITRRATSMPKATYVAEIDWSVEFAHAIIDGREFLVPRCGKYDVSYANSYRHEWNLIHFSDYHRYGVEVAVHFR